MVMDNTWLNDDGLYVKFGKTEGVSRTQGGFTCSYGPYLDYWFNLDLTSLDANENIQNDVLAIAANSLIWRVQCIAVEAAATGTAIDVGLIANDRVTTTNLNASLTDADPNGLLAAFPTASMNAVGEWNLYTVSEPLPEASNTFAGALIGTILTVPTLLTASRTDATAFTTGKLLINITTIPMATTGFTQTHVG